MEESEHLNLDWGKEVVSDAQIQHPWSLQHVKLSEQRGGLPFKRLIEEKLQNPRYTGNCYRCVEIFFMGHRCKNKQLQVLLVEEDDTEGDIEEEEEESDQPALLDVAKLSLNSTLEFLPLRP